VHEIVRGAPVHPLFQMGRETKVGCSRIRSATKALAIRSYPCTGLGVWLAPFISRSPAYSTILQRLAPGRHAHGRWAAFLGGDMRRLVVDACAVDEHVWP